MKGVSRALPGAASSTSTDAVNPRRANWIDDVLADSFPASDPPSWTPGMARPVPKSAGSPAPLAFLVSYVEDEREMYGEAMKLAGFEVRTFADPSQALTAAIADQPGIVVTRILQPGFDLDGLELTRRIRRHPRTQGAAVVAITSLIANVHRAAAAEAGCDTLLALPCLPDELVTQIRQTLGRRSIPAIKLSTASMPGMRGRSKVKASLVDERGYTITMRLSNGTSD